MKNFKKNINGITLIALVVTIIILLILAGVTLNTLTGEYGILTKVVDAKTKTEMAEIKERAELVKAELNIDLLSGNFKTLIEKNVLLSKLQEEFEGSTRSGDTIITSDKKYDIVVDNDSNITVIEHTKSSGGGITLVYSIEHENTSAIILKVHPIIDDIKEPTEEELYQKAQEAIDNLPTDETERNAAIDKMFIESINIMIKSGFPGIPKETVITTLSDALQFMGVNENYSSLKEFYEARLSGSEGEPSFDEFIFILQCTIEAFKYVKMITIECSNGESYVITNSEYSTITITRNGKYIITAKDENGNTGKIEFKITQLIEEKFSKIYEKTTQITSEDGKEVWIPEGFAVGISDNINKVSEGLVITDNVDEEGYSIGNEFVWVPVDSNEFQRSGGSKESLSTSYTEPYTNGYEKETQEYEKMKSSVETNGGFYIGRYEAGKDSDGNVVVQRGVDVYTNIGWSNSDDMKNEEGGAVEKAKDFKKGKAYENSLTSTLIYGIQWDATMQFFDSRYIDGIPEENIKNSYVSDSTGMGNYSGKVAKTGISTEYSTKNIYDMAGNIWEWTMEANNTNGRVVRGGHYNNSGSSSPVSARYSYSPSVSGGGVGFRLALYIEL